MTDKTQAHLPVTPDTRLWCLHHIGPDDVHPAPDFATAQKWADWANLRFAEHSDLSRFVVAIWPWSAERHAEGLAKSIEEWTLPAVGFDKEWCISMAKQEAGYAIGAGELAIDPFTSPSAEAYAANMKSAGEKIGRDLADQAQAAANLRRGLPISHSLPGDVGRSEWMNLMPREVVARAALGEGCRDETADNIRYGFHRDVKIRAEVAVKLVASIQDDVRAALTPSPCPGDVGIDRDAAKEVALRISEEMFSHPDDQTERDIAYGAAFAGIIEVARNHGQTGIREALAWYAEQVAGCRKVGSLGRPYQERLDADGGKRARDAIAALTPSALSPEHCQRCGHNNPSWSAPSPLWNAVIRGGSIDGEPKFDDMVCAACFMELAEQQGIASDWTVKARNVAVPLETTTPSGRVWDEDKGLWVSALSGDAGEGE